jgi:signal transduction histidine kinase
MTWARAAWEWYRRSPARDVLFALVMTAITLYGSYGEGHPHSKADLVQFNGLAIPQPGPAALVLVAVASLALAFRNRWPQAVLAVSTAGVLAFTLLGYVNGAALLAPAAAVYSVATRLGAWRALADTAVALAVLMTATATRNPFGNLTTGPTEVMPVLFAAVCLGGIAVSNRRAYVASIHARAEEDARRRVDEERLRIARELHDVVAHTMSTINVQANAAAAVLADKPDVAAEALQAIRNASRDGLRELRSILNILRQADDIDSTTPAPGLAQVGSLVDHAARAGLPTTLDVTGKAIPLSPATDLAAYRIIQESLTNAIRHAGPATATVSLAYTADALQVEVADTGMGGLPAGTDGAGHGIIGMRERAAAAGGFLHAGPRPAGGGFLVTARLPVRAPDNTNIPDSADARAEPESARP